MARYNVDLQDNEGNAYQIMANPDSVAEFSPAANRENIRSGETHRIIFGKIMKYLSEGGNAAYVGLANNCTTTVEGFALDARQGKELMDRVNELNRDLGRVRIYVGGDGKLHWVDRNGADSALPFSVEPYINTKYIIATRQTYSISIGRPANCISIYNRHLKGTSYAGFSMAIKNGSKLTMVGSDPNGSIGSKIENWDVTFTNTGVIFKAPSTILYNSIECEVFVC